MLVGTRGGPRNILLPHFPELFKWLPCATTVVLKDGDRVSIPPVNDQDGSLVGCLEHFGVDDTIEERCGESFEVIEMVLERREYLRVFLRDGSGLVGRDDGTLEASIREIGKAHT